MPKTGFYFAAGACTALVEGRTLTSATKMPMRRSRLTFVRRGVWLLALFAGLAVGGTGFAQPARPGPVSPGTSAISGVIRDARTKRPIAGCSVTLNQLNLPRNAITTSDAAGAYAFSGIADAEYYIHVLCDSHLASCYRAAGTEAPRCDSVGVVADQHKADVDLNLIEGATATGRVIDANGRPIADATVRLGLPRVDARFTATNPANTDREGTFTLKNLPVGGYLMEVDLPQEAGALRPPIIYFPGVLQFGDASFVELASGQTTELTIVAPRLTDNSLTVRVVTSEQALSGLEVSFVRVTPLVTRPVSIDANGSGTIKGLTPGQYFLTARGVSQDKKWAAHEVIEFFGGEQETLLYLQPAARISGRIVGEKGAAVDLGGVRVGATWLRDGLEVNPLDITEAPVSPNGTFLLDGLFGTRRLQLMGLDPEWHIRSVVHDRSDVTAGGVTLSADSEAKVVITLAKR